MLEASQPRNSNPCKRLWLRDHVCDSGKNSLASAGSRRRRGAWGRPIDRDERTRAAVRWRRTVRPILATTTEEFRIRACRRSCCCMNYGILMLQLVCRNDNRNCSNKKQADQGLQNQLKSPHDYYKKQTSTLLGRNNNSSFSKTTSAKQKKSQYRNSVANLSELRSEKLMGNLETTSCCKLWIWSHFYYEKGCVYINLAARPRGVEQSLAVQLWMLAAAWERSTDGRGCSS
jgi:hypothetical protein